MKGMAAMGHFLTRIATEKWLPESVVKRMNINLYGQMLSDVQVPFPKASSK